MPVTMPPITPENPVLPPAPENLEFRADIRPTEVHFGRCGITGQFGTVVTVDIGDISIEGPVIDSAETDPNTGKIIFTKWQPHVFNNQLTVSEAGLLHLLHHLKNADNPIPEIKPYLCYSWQVMYTDGMALKQFQFDPETAQEVETSSREIDSPRIKEAYLVPHDDPTLPTYAFVKETNTFYRNGVPIDLSSYDVPDFDEEATLVCQYRNVQHTFGSQVQGMKRTLHHENSVITYYLGWKVGGLSGHGKGIILSIDERGNWRPKEITLE